MSVGLPWFLGSGCVLSLSTLASSSVDGSRLSIFQPENNDWPGLWRLQAAVRAGDVSEAWSAGPPGTVLPVARAAGRVLDTLSWGRRTCVEINASFLSAAHEACTQVPP